MEKIIKGNLLLIGGAEDKEGDCRILRYFLEQVGAQEGPVCVITVASSAGESKGEMYRRVLARLGWERTETLFVQNREQAYEEENRRKLQRAGGIFFTGGDQLRITGLLGGSPLEGELRCLYEKNVVIAGTSAGASAMSETMIVGGQGDTPGEGLLRMAPGLGFLEEVVVDQHFAQRGRIGRLLTAVAFNPRVLGLGLDEDTAVHWQKGQGKVLGRGTALFLDGKDATLSNAEELSEKCPLSLAPLRLHVLGEGGSFDFQRRACVGLGEKE